MPFNVSSHRFNKIPKAVKKIYNTIYESMLQENAL